MILLFPTTTQELHRLQSAIQQAAHAVIHEGHHHSVPTVNLVSWQHDHIGTRRELLDIFSRHLPPRRARFLQYPIAGSNIDSDEFGTLERGSMALALAVCRQTLKGIIEYHVSRPFRIND